MRYGDFFVCFFLALFGLEGVGLEDESDWRLGLRGRRLRRYGGVC